MYTYTSGLTIEIGQEDTAAFEKLSNTITELSPSSLKHLKIIFGQENSYVAIWDHGLLWHNVPKTLLKELQRREASKAAVLRVIALGSHGTWLAIWGEDDMMHDLKGHYKSMSDTLRASKPQNIEVSYKFLPHSCCGIYGSQHVAIDSFTTERYIVFYNNQTFSTCTYRDAADILARWHNFYWQKICTMKNTTVRLKRKSRTANSDSIAVLDFSPLTVEQLTTAEERLKSPLLEVSKSELIDLGVEILSEKCDKREHSGEKHTPDMKTKMNRNDETKSKDVESLVDESWHDADTGTLA